MRRTIVWTISALGVMMAAGYASAAAQTLGTTSTVISAADSRTRETSAGNLLADAVRTQARADAAVVPADALTDAEIAKGPITRADLKSLLEDPDDTVSVLTVTGAQLKAALERGVSACPKSFDGFLQVSGLTVEYAADKNASPRVRSVRVNGQPLDANRRYRVGTLNSLATGGLGYYNLWDQKDVADSGVSVLDALATTVKAQKTIAPREEGRISGK